MTAILADSTCPICGGAAKLILPSSSTPEHVAFTASGSAGSNALFRSAGRGSRRAEVPAVRRGGRGLAETMTAILAASTC
jgi:hypothetical protein